MKLSFEDSLQSVDFDLGVVRRSFEFTEELEDELDEEEDEPVIDLRLGVSTPILEHVLASSASGLLLASS